MAVFLLAGLAAASAGGQDRPPESELVGPRLGLGEAVALAIGHAPDVAQAGAVLQERDGALREAGGLFDSVFTWGNSLDYGREELTPTRRRAETNRRLRFELPAEFLDEVAVSLIQRLPTDNTMLFSDCTGTQTIISVENALPGTPIFICLNSRGEIVGVIDPGGAFSTASASDLRFLAFLEGVQGLDASIDAVSQDYVNFFADLLRILSRQLHITASSLRLQRAWLGGVPFDDESIDFTSDLAYQWRFRRGSALTSTLSLVSSEANYGGKLRDPRYGDQLVPNSFFSTFGLTLDLPLGRGAGISADAPERAAAQAASAASHFLEQSASEVSLSTVVAYVDLAAAQDRVRLLDESVRRQERILEGTQELVNADQVPAIDLKRTSARLAQTRSDALSARATLSTARLDLQRAMGLEAKTIEVTPLAGETLEALLPDDLSGPGELEALVARALDHRGDVLASSELYEANNILAEAARHDLAPEFGLRFNVSFNGLHESFKDRWYDLEGFYRAADGTIAGPSYGGALTFKLPLGNNSARGRLLQAEASTAQARIDEVDLQRDVRLRLIETRGTVEATRATLAALGDSVRYSQETLESSVELFRAGELSVIDSLFTEEQVTQARLGWIDAAQRYLSALAQLRFEAHGLLAGQVEEGGVLRLRLVRLDEPMP
jgi:outer membrane protein TolC